MADDPWDDFKPSNSDPWAEFQAETSRPDPGLLANIAQAAAASVPGGAHIQAALQTYIPGTSGYGRPYTENYANQAQQQQQVRQQHPGLSTAASLAEAVPEYILGGGLTKLASPAINAAERFGKNVTLGGILGGIHGAGESQNLGDWEQTFGAGSRGAAIGGAVSGAPTLAGALGGKTFISRNPLTSAVPVADVQAAKNNAYENAFGLGAAYRPKAFNDLVDTMTESAQAKGIDASTHPAAHVWLQKAQQQANLAQLNGQPVSLQELYKQRTLLNDNVISSGGREAVVGREMKRDLDQFIRQSGSNNAITPQGLSLNRIPETPLTPEESDLYLHSADAARRSIHGNYEGGQYTINDPAGAVKGQAHLLYDPETKAVDVAWVGRKGASEMQDTGIPYSEFANTLGHGQIRPLLSEVKREFPEAQTIGGFRVSGARTGPAANKDEASSAVIGNAALKLPALTPSGSSEAVAGVQNANQLNQTYEKYKALQGALEHKRDLLSTMTNAASWDTKMRQAAHTFKDAQGPYGLTPREAELTQNVIEPGWFHRNVLETAAKASPLNYLSGAAELAGPMTGHGFALPAEIAGAGQAARALGSALTGRKFRALQAEILRNYRPPIVPSQMPPWLQAPMGSMLAPATVTAIPGT